MPVRGVRILGHGALRGRSRLAIGLGDILTRDIAQRPPAFRQSSVSQRIVRVAADRRLVETNRLAQIGG